MKISRFRFVGDKFCVLYLEDQNKREYPQTVYLLLWVSEMYMMDFEYTVNQEVVR